MLSTTEGDSQSARVGHPSGTRAPLIQAPLSHLAHPSQANSLKSHFSGQLRAVAAANCPQGRSLQIHPLTGCAPSSPLQSPQLWKCAPYKPLNLHPWLSAHSHFGHQRFHILGTSHIPHPTFPLWEMPPATWTHRHLSPSQVPRAHPFGGTLSLCLLFTVPPP